MNASRWTRRDLLGRATTASVAATAVGWLGAVRSARADEGEKDSGAEGASALDTGAPVPLAYESLPGFLSREQVGLHHTKHYGGALNGLLKIEARLYGSEGVTDGAARKQLGESQSAKANSVILHELYFGGMGAKETTPDEHIGSAIKKRFGSVDRWRADFEACALAADGWAMLALHPLNGRLYNVLSNAHDVGPLWFARPLAIIDVYEHAFYVDYRNDKATYVSKWIDRIDWVEADRRMRASR